MIIFHHIRSYCYYHNSTKHYQCNNFSYPHPHGFYRVFDLAVNRFAAGYRLFFFFYNLLETEMKKCNSQCMIAALRIKSVKQLSWEAARWNRKLLYLSSRYEWGTL